MPTKSTTAKEIQTIRASLRQLQRSFDRLASALAATAKGQKARRRPQLTPAQRAALKLQGRYMGTMRNLKPAQKARVKKIRAAKGIRAAIAEAKRLAS